MQASDVIKRIRRFIDQVPFATEDVKTDSSVIGSPSTQFSDENLLQRINAAQREIVSKVKAQHVPLSIFRYDTAEGKPLPVIDDEVVRLLFSRVLFTGTTGDPNISAPYDPQGFYEGVPPANAILHQIIAGRVITVLDIDVTTDVNPSSVQTLTLVNHTTDTIVGSVTLNPSGNHVTTIIGGSFKIKTGEVFRIIAGPNIDAEDFSFSYTATAEVFTTDTVEGVRCVQRTVDRHRRLERSGRNATAFYPVYTYEDGELRVYPDFTQVVCFFVKNPPELEPVDLASGTDTLVVDERFEYAVIVHVAASCYQSMGQPDIAAYYRSVFEDEISAYALQNRLNSIIDDREVDVE